MPDWIDDLKAEVGAERVLDSAELLDPYSYDAWPLAVKWRNQGRAPHRPEAVIRPLSVQEISRVLKWASERGIPVTPRGAGSAVTGAALPLRGGIVLDLAEMDRILALDATNMLVKVEAGVMGHVLEAALNERGCTLNHSPQSLDRSTVGGWVSTRASGQFSSRWGSIEDLLTALTVVLPTGEIVETPLAPRAATGPDLKALFAGAEGTLGVIVDVTLRIFPIAEHRIFETVSFAEVESGVTAMRRMMQSGLRPFLVRFYDQDETRHVARGTDIPGCAMLLGFEGLRSVTEAEYAAGLDICRQERGTPLGPDVALRWMDRRFDFSTVENLLAQPGGVAETIEVAHFWDSIVSVYRALKSALQPHADEVLGHFSHVYTHGTSLYLILLGSAADDAAAETRLQAIWDSAMRTCLEYGAAISHHHGIGLARLPYLRRSLGSSAQILGRVKGALDPQGILNPGKLVQDD